jgi:hypothetical protein
MPFRLQSSVTNSVAKSIFILLAFSLAGCGDNDFDEIKSSIERSEDGGKNNQETIEPSPENPPEPPKVPVEPSTPKNEQASGSSTFLSLPDGSKLANYRVSSSALRLATGSGKSFTSSNQSAYKKLKRETQNEIGHKVQWTFMNLETGKIIERSLSADKKIFGASSSKIYVAAALLDRLEGKLTKEQTQTMAEMLVVSSNTAWKDLQREVGSGSSDKGRERIHRFTQRMGYEKTRGFQGYWGDLHGNELTPDESAQTLYDIYQNNFKGAETLWKIMYTCRTGINRGRRYLPSDLYVGGKTGSYSGPTENPENGKSYNVRVKNHLLIFAVDGVQYGLAVLANSGTDESAALLAGGLIREHTSIR